MDREEAIPVGMGVKIWATLLRIEVSLLFLNRREGEGVLNVRKRNVSLFCDLDFSALVGRDNMEISENMGSLRSCNGLKPECLKEEKFVTAV